MHHANVNQSSNQNRVHTLGFLEHGRITGEVRDGIHKEQTYKVTEISPDGAEKNKIIPGNEIIKNYANIFGAYLHGYVVRDEHGTIIFVYTGPIPTKVNNILSKSIN